MLQTHSSQVVFKADIALFQNVLAFFWEYWIGGGEVTDEVKSRTEESKVRDAS